MTEQKMNRRHAMAGLGAVVAGGVALSNADAALLGWNEQTRAFELPDLPYGPDDLEPHIDGQTMRIHHGKHHAGYVRGLNNALAKLDAIRVGREDAGLIQHWSRQLSFHLGGHLNHAVFWRCMAPAGSGGGGEPSGALRAAIERDFGSYAAFAAHFKIAATAVEGSGWGWLAYLPEADQLMVLQMESQQKLAPMGVVPLVGVDVWEHAYYLKYQNRRSDYVDAFMNVVNWSFAAERFEAARG